MFDLSGKSALVTGASAGLGRHFAALLARQGAAITLAARRADALEEACAEIIGEGGQARAVPLDLTDVQAIRDVIAGLDRPPDILINNAGVSGAGAALNIEEKDWDPVLDLNLKGAFFASQALARRLVEEGRPGAIVNIASILGLRTGGGVAAYTASKAGLVHLTRSLALEWARHGIRVNALCPGYFETDLNRDFFATEAGAAMIRRIPQRRLGTLTDLDAPLLLLASDEGAYVTGTTLAVDGGHLVSSL